MMFDNATANIEVPQRYRDNVAVVVEYLSIADVEKKCGRKAIACMITSVDRPPYIVARNPCTLKYDLHARDMCHEVGHVNGWGKDHGR